MVPSTRTAARNLHNTAMNLARRRPLPRTDLPKPSGYKPEIKTAEDHALWGFFRPDKKSLTTPKDDAKHGRSWTAEELRRKSFDDLHALWIVCLKERNILATQRHERRRQQITSGGSKEATERDRTVRRTMAGIKFVLNERFLAWSRAAEIAAEEDAAKAPEVSEDSSIPDPALKATPIPAGP